MNGQTVVDQVKRWFFTRPPMLQKLLLANLGVYVLVLVTGFFGERIAGLLPGQLSLNPGLADLLLHPWQVLTYGFVHTNQQGFIFGLLHLTFNLLWLVWIGEEFEHFYGAARLGWVYFWSTLGGAALTVVLHALAPGSPAFTGPVYGATAPVVGVVAAVVQVFPDKRIGLLFLGVVPLRYALLGFLGLSVLFGLGGGTFFAAHIGGAVGGILFARSLLGRREAAERPSGRREPAKSGQASGMLASVDRWLGERARQTPKAERKKPDIVGEAVGQNEVDRILDKISEQGYEALTDEERRTLYEASKR